MLLLFGCGCFLVSWLWSVAFINASVASGVSLLCHGRWGLGAGGRGSCANVRCLLHQWSMRDDCAEAGRHQLPGASWPPYPDFSQKLGCSIAVLEYQRVHIVCLLCMYHLIYIYIYTYTHLYYIYIYIHSHTDEVHIYPAGGRKRTLLRLWLPLRKWLETRHNAIRCISRFMKIWATTRTVCPRRHVPIYLPLYIYNHIIYALLCIIMHSYIENILFVVMHVGSREAISHRSRFNKLLPHPRPFYGRFIGSNLEPLP